MDFCLLIHTQNRCYSIYLGILCIWVFYISEYSIYLGILYIWVFYISKYSIYLGILYIWVFYIERLLHDIFHIGPGISPRLPYQARQRSWRADMGRGLIPGTIWKISCHHLFITYFTLTFSKHWLLYCKKDLWTDKLRK